MGTERKRDNNDVQRTRRRFSDRLEIKRGQVDARAGRPPASMHPQYLAGYAEGRRQARTGRRVKTNADSSEPGPSSWPSARDGYRPDPREAQSPHGRGREQREPEAGRVG